MNVLELFKPITTFVFDVDGVLTNSMLLVLNDGQMNIKDGYALQQAVKKGYRIVVISSGNSTAVQDKLHKLGIKDVFMEAGDKKTCLIEYVAQHQLLWDEILFMGDDIPDYGPMQLVGLPCCPSDATMEIKQVSKYVSPLPGGNGCVREVIEKVLKLNGHWEVAAGTAAK